MQDFCLHKSTLGQFTKQLFELISSGKRYRVKISEWRNKRSLSQNALSHVWYAEISKYLIKHGRAHCTEKWVKKNLKSTFLGCEEVEYTNFRTGEKTISYEPRHTSDLDTGDMHYFMTQVEEWAGQFGLILSNPADGEYNQLKQKQVA
ncbi:hypothetical protein [Serratia fonticola]|uniref:hypothetical protein n=1 Tax=Serratia fonticola TaxID=47917 RepID=UPI003AAC5730|nr:hypothetical protein [Serratia fonticola]